MSKFIEPAGDAPEPPVSGPQEDAASQGDLRERRFFLKMMVFAAGAATPMASFAQQQQLQVGGVGSVTTGCGVITYDLSGLVVFATDPDRVRVLALNVDGVVTSGPGTGPINVQLTRPLQAQLQGGGGVFNAQASLAFSDPFNEALRFRTGLAGVVQNGIVSDLDFSGVVNSLCDMAKFSTADVVLNMDGVQPDPFTD